MGKRPCMYCEKEWDVADILGHIPPNLVVPETVAERICSLCKAKSKHIRSILHGDFTLSPMLPNNWSGFFKGNLFILTCPDCARDFKFRPLMGVTKRTNDGN